MKFWPFYLVLISVFSVRHIHAQGCSDAGLCMVKSFRPQSQLITDKKNQLSFGVSAGAADYSIMAFGAHLSYSRQIGKQWSLDSKATSMLHTGNHLSSFGPGDIFVNLNFKPASKWTISGGMKIPLTDGDALHDGKSLPMDYQSSLGTLDLIGGIGYRTAQGQYVIAFQQPLSQNQNYFESTAWPEGSPIREIPSTVGFTRKGDVLFRAIHFLELNDRLQLAPALLLIYHLGEDGFYENNRFQPIVGSDGLTVNANVFFDVSLRQNSKLNLSLGFPILVRELRPDGLTRSFVFGAEYSFSF